MNPLVSIIIPVYNAEKYLAETIKSVTDQTYRNIELIIVDDSSTDDSYTLAKSFEKENVKIFRQENSGASAARNLGLANAKGTYIQFLDADDLLSKDKVEGQLNQISTKPNYIANCRTIHFFDGENLSKLKPSEYEDKFYRSTEETDEFLIKLWGGYSKGGSMVATHAWLIPKSLIDLAGNWNENITTDDDGEFFARIILNASGIVYTPDVFVFYRKNQFSSLSNINSEKKLKSSLAAAKIKTHLLLQRNSSKAAKLASYKLLLDIAVRSFPKYYKIYQEAMKMMPKIENEGYLPQLGGPKIQRLAKYFGWKTARLLQFVSKPLS